MPDNVCIFLPLLLCGIAVVLGLCLCHLAAPRQSATDRVEPARNDRIAPGVEVEIKKGPFASRRGVS
jgi:hypothetical protein